VSCRLFRAYHASFVATLPGGGTATVPYVVVPRCSALESDLTLAVCHELIETATDPVDPDPALGGTAYSMAADTVWPVFGSGGQVRRVRARQLRRARRRAAPSDDQRQRCPDGGGARLPHDHVSLRRRPTSVAPRRHEPLTSQSPLIAAVRSVFMVGAPGGRLVR